MEATVKKTLIIPVSQLSVLKELTLKYGWKEEGIKDKMARLKNAPRGKAPYTDDEIIKEIKSYRNGY